MLTAKIVLVCVHICAYGALKPAMNALREVALKDIDTIYVKGYVGVEFMIV